MPGRLWVLDTDHLSLLQRRQPNVVVRLRAMPLGQRITTVQWRPSLARTR